jgi:hypothetical protein
MCTLRRTKNLRAIQELLGHSDIKTFLTFCTDETIEDRAGDGSDRAARDLREHPKRIENK